MAQDRASRHSPLRKKGQQRALSVRSRQSAQQSAVMTGNSGGFIGHRASHFGHMTQTRRQGIENKDRMADGCERTFCDGRHIA
jgi:hypothetical protein